MCSTKSRIVWGRSTVVGISCFLYVLPGVVAFLMGGTADDSDMKLWSAITLSLWLLQALLSFNSDYVFAGRSSVAHILDRGIAPTMALFITWRTIVVIATARLQWYHYLSILFGIPFIFQCLYNSRKCETGSQFRLWHSMWHLTSSVGCGFVTYLEFTYHWL